MPNPSFVYTGGPLIHFGPGLQASAGRPVQQAPGLVEVCNQAFVDFPAIDLVSYPGDDFLHCWMLKLQVFTWFWVGPRKEASSPANTLGCFPWKVVATNTIANPKLE